MSARRPFPWIRLLTILSIGIYVQIGPLWSQGLHRGRLAYAMPWRMYSGAGVGFCQVDFRQVSEDGALVPLDRYEILGHEPWYLAPKHIRSITSVAQVARTGRTMCRKMGGEHEVRVWASCGSQKGWRPERRLDGVNLCTIRDTEIAALENPRKKRKKKPGAKP